MLTIDELLQDLPSTWRVELLQSDAVDTSGKWWCRIFEAGSPWTLALGPYTVNPSETLFIAIEKALEHEKK